MKTTWADNINYTFVGLLLMSLAVSFIMGIWGLGVIIWTNPILWWLIPAILLVGFVAWNIGRLALKELNT